MCCYNKINIKKMEETNQTMKYPTKLSDAVHILTFIALPPADSDRPGAVSLPHAQAGRVCENRIF